MENRTEKSALTLKVNITDTDLFARYLSVSKDMVEDERIPREIREEYRNRLLNLAEELKHGN